MLKFKTNKAFFKSEAKRQRVYGITIFLLLAFYFESEWSSGLSIWFEGLVLVIILIYIVLELIGFEEVDFVINNYSISLLDNVIRFPEEDIQYSELAIFKIKKKNEKVIEIHLKRNNGDIIKLRGLENMNKLFENIDNLLNKDT
ncbi:MAG: hypothetical protein OQL19_04090 [Gammaproteobacteria bacterium]|nr:hypothetical protein [Gammaproteobacteria bacterium]